MTCFFGCNRRNPCKTPHRYRRSVDLHSYDGLRGINQFYLKSIQGSAISDQNSFSFHQAIPCFHRRHHPHRTTQSTYTPDRNNTTSYNLISFLRNGGSRKVDTQTQCRDKTTAGRCRRDSPPFALQSPQQAISHSPATVGTTQLAFHVSH
jgi:hypothetical protein